ncbi:MAG: hypothetical protein HY674_21630 [Chloroflexi bacterium]|nr:hypothetical protein [Chloroflexota bacterium]
MKPAMERRDLLVLVADRDMDQAVSGLLQRHQALGIRPLEAVIQRHPERDAGCAYHGVEYLRLFIRYYQHAILMFDWEGSGREDLEREALEMELTSQLATSGWQNRAAVIALQPELEVWVWSDSPHVESILGWGGKAPGLRRWLRRQGLWRADEPKPRRPKEAMRAALRTAGRPRSQVLFRQLADQVSLVRCSDPAFAKFRSVLKQWFSQS